METGDETLLVASSRDARLQVQQGNTDNGQTLELTPRPAASRLGLATTCSR